MDSQEMRQMIPHLGCTAAAASAAAAVPIPGIATVASTAAVAVAEAEAEAEADTTGSAGNAPIQMRRFIGGVALDW
eukprot:CAMPEP_0173192762 /NCGR_PEP_ID=MMETSP1141-20130122/13591_1 /TAXON_ID=483371 /ORGANISM="non described non described, Strain CCMP2298" /LENGTH=75 /DNA_ID=CAMNT_0014117039 /DNA_START=669 /DNA_END=893 /DNA_ORIENTATION=-